VGDVRGDDAELILQSGRVGALEQAGQTRIADHRRWYPQADHELIALVREPHVHYLLADDLVSGDRPGPAGDRRRGDQPAGVTQN